MTFIEAIKEKAKQSIKTIILPESEDLRVLEGASKVLKEGFAKIILIGNEEEVIKVKSHLLVRFGKAGGFVFMGVGVTAIVCYRAP